MSEDKINATLKRYNRNFMIGIVAAMVFVGGTSASVATNIARGNAESEVAEIRGVLMQREDNVVALRDARDEYRDKAFHCESGYRQARTVDDIQSEGVVIMEGMLNGEVSPSEVESYVSRLEGSQAVNEDMAVLYDELCLGEK